MKDNAHILSTAKEREYLAKIRNLFISRKCTKDHLSEKDRQLLQEWYDSGIPDAAIKAAILLGCCRKLVSWLNNGERSKINSLHYFIPLIQEVGNDYQNTYYQVYVKSKITEFEKLVE